MAEHLVKTLCHIVFILKLYSKFLLGLFHCPAYLQLAPLPEELCSSGNAADYQVNRYHGTLTPPRIAPSRPFKEKTEVSLYPASASSQAAAPHDCYSSPVVAHSFREVLASEAVLLRRSGKIRSTELFSFQGTSEAV